MKNMLILVGILGAFAVKAESVVNLPVLAYLPTQFELMHEIKTNQYEKVVLDCQGYVMGMYFYQNGKYERQIVMTEKSCLEFDKFLVDTQEQHQPVCLELDRDSNSLDVTDKDLDECK